MHDIHKFKEEINQMKSHLSSQPIPSTTFSVEDYLQWRTVKQLEEVCKLLNEVKQELSNLKD